MSAPTAAFTRLSERVGGEILVTLYELTVSAPVAKTWYLAETSLDVDALYAGSPAYEGLVMEGTGRPESAVAVGGAASVPGFTLVLADLLGTYRGKGGRRRFSDQFTELVPGFSEPYDLASAELLIRLAWVGLTSGDRLTIGRYKVMPSGIGIQQDTSPKGVLIPLDRPTLDRPTTR